MTDSILSQILADDMKRGTSVMLLDVRTPAEFQAVHAVGASNVPLDVLDPGRFMAGRSADAPVYVICHSGARARTACERFIAAGFANAVLVEGGTKAWQAAGCPVVTGKQSLSVERQVRLVIGLGVIAGVILALTVNPWCALISGFFGAGLTMAGITDCCPLALMVAAMPWNRGCTSGSCCVPAPKS